MEQEKREIVLSCLEKVLKSPEFAASERLSDFLRFIVGETLEGRGDRLKAYSIAVGAFGYEESFDPQENSLVRVEASRLRKKLGEYYARAGGDDPLEIQVKKGSYTPEFITRYSYRSHSSPPIPMLPAAGIASCAMPEVQPGPQQPNGLGGRETETPPVTRADRVEKSRFLIATVAVVGCLAIFAALLALPSPRPPANPAVAPLDLPPTLAVAQLEIAPETGLTGLDAQTMARELQSTLARFPTLRILDIGGASASRAAEYRLASDATRDGNILQLNYRLIYTASAQVLWSRTFNTSGLVLDEANRASISASLASTLARGYGVIVADRFARMPELSATTRGFSCVVHGFRYFEEPSEQGFKSARKCLEATIAASPKDSSAQAMLAILLADGWVKAIDEPPDRGMLIRAGELSNQAALLSPQSAQAHLAMFVVRFIEGRFGDAFEAGEKARTLNPYSDEIKSRLGAGYVARGEYDKGIALLQDAASSERASSWAQFYLFLHAYMRNDNEAALRVAQRGRMARMPFGIVARIAMHQRHGSVEDAHFWRQQLAREFPHFAADIEGALIRSGMHRASEPPCCRT